MKFYNSIGPNPRMVRMFMAEKGIEIPKVEVDLRHGENRREPYTKNVNPAGQTPALELDDGTVIAEITAICEYVDELKSDKPSLIGSTPQEFASSLQLLADGKVDAPSLITAKVGLEGVKRAFAELGNPEQHTKILVEPWR